MNSELDRWFAREILAHEEAFVRYLRRVWPNQDEVHDLRQEAYIRVYEAAAKSRPASPKSFLFTTARNLITDRVRRERVVSIETREDLDELNVLVDELSPEKRANARQELKRLAGAFDRLPPRVREVLWLRRVEEVSQKEAAARMHVTEATIEKQLSKGVRMLADMFFGASREVSRGEDTSDESEERDAKQHSN
jgi:RNA polymerase sigma factor (sigma-70 family)